MSNYALLPARLSMVEDLEVTAKKKAVICEGNKPVFT
jgi:hypothetical protein